jgi:hypothetical protein
MRRGCVSGLADHDDVSMALEPAPLALAHHRVIVHQQHADHFFIILNH